MPGDDMPNDNSSLDQGQQPGADVTPQGQQPAAGEPPSSPQPGDGPSFEKWFVAEGLEGTGDKPEWFKGDKYQTVSDQAKAYVDLESKFGSFTGAPDEYEINLSDGIKELDLAIDPDDPLVQSAMEYARATNMNQEGFDQLVNLYAETRVAEFNAIAENKQEQIKSLGDRADERIANLVNWGEKNLPPDRQQGWMEMAQSAEAVKTMEDMVSMIRGQSLQPNNADTVSPVTAEEVKAMQFEKDENGNRRIQTDPEFRAKFEKMKNQVWGAEPHRVIIGPK